MMKRIQYREYGGPEVLRLEEFTLAAPKRDEVRIRVMAAAANPMDWKIRKGDMKMLTGRSFPRGLGHDFAGVVEAIGPNAKNFKVGDEVFGATGLKEAGAFAEALVAGEKTVFSKPRSLSFEAAAALPIVSGTAWTALVDKAKLQAGQRMFISGCLGGVGQVATQLSRMRGAVVVGSCSASRREQAIALGVSEIVDYRTFNASQHRGRYDVVLDTHGSLSLGECDTMLKGGGVALHIVPTPKKVLRSLFSPRHKTIFARLTPEWAAGISAAVQQGEFGPTIGKVARLSEAIPALAALEKGELTGGKLVIVPYSSVD